MEERSRPNDRNLEILTECVEGMKRRHVYFCRKQPPGAGTIPEKGMLGFIAHESRRYIPLIDDVAWGLAIYDRILDPWEIVRFGLISAPRGCSECGKS